MNPTIRKCLEWPVLKELRSFRRKVLFQRTFKEFAANYDDFPGWSFHNAYRLVYGWGNEDFSSTVHLLQCSVREAIQSTGPYLECGAGLSTLILGTVAREQGTVLHSLEHDREWYGLMLKKLRFYELEPFVELHYAPLKSFGSYHWYDATKLKGLPLLFGLILCDGPPGDTPGGRSGLWDEVLKGNSGPFCLVLDDAWRSNERMLLEQWSSLLNVKYEISQHSKPYGIIKVP